MACQGLVQRSVLRLLRRRSFRSTSYDSQEVDKSVGSDPQGPTRFTGAREDVAKLKEIQLNVYRGRLERDASYMNTISHELSGMLNQASLDRATVDAIGKVLRLFGFNQPYRQEFFESLSEALLKTQSEAVFNALLPSFLWVCNRCQHYPKDLLTHTGNHLLDNMCQFNSADINMMVHAFAKFNHHVPGLIDRIERWFFENETLTFENHLPWTLAWAGMVFAEYPRDMLSAILNDEYIEGKINR